MSRATQYTCLLSLLLGACAAPMEEGDDAFEDSPVMEDVVDPDQSGPIDEAADAADAEEEDWVGTTQQALVRPYDVGVIMPAGSVCPDEHVMLTNENERESNDSYMSGWVGATTQSGGKTMYHFCRVDGQQFSRARSTLASSNYAVLKLGTTCPSGSVEFERYFDNEDRPRGCPSWPWACGIGKPETIGTYGPSYYSSNNLHMKMCMFRASATGSLQPFPSIGIPYGVFGTSALPFDTGSGIVYQDDEDDSNRNKLTGNTWGAYPFLTVGSNTRLRIVKIEPMTTMGPAMMLKKRR